MNSIGYMRANGIGVDRDEKQAFTWYTKAASHGHVEAAYNLAMAYHTGAGTAKDDAQALFWARAAAEKGHTEAASLVAVIESNPPH